jgi:DtxR family transcriptional regulator, Mn-dependent transcriptional regulator
MSEENRVTLTPAHEDYIEAIVELEESQNHPEIRSVDIANLLGVSKASVNKAVQTLRDSDYIEQERYGRITLTDSGRAYGKEIWARHNMLRAFLVEDLGVDEEIAEQEACEMEHTVSHETIDKWSQWLDRVHEAMSTQVEE